MSAVDELVKLLKREKQTGSDYTGTVTRVDGKIAYVNITGSSIADTPVSRTIDAKVGDRVRLRVSGGRAWLTGNDTAPPTSDKENLEKIRSDLKASEKNTEKEISRLYRLIRGLSRPEEKSYIGMVIHSTTLDTMEKVTAFYGGTAWIRHSGYMLRGASSDVTANSAVKTGGAETVTLTADQLPSHNHGSSGGITNGITGGSHSHTYEYVGDASSNLSGQNSSDFGSVMRRKNPTEKTGLSTAAATHTHNLPNHTHTSVGKGQAHNNMPPYKNVYIWERTA